MLIKEITDKMDNSFFWIRTVTRKINKFLHISEGFDCVTGYDREKLLNNVGCIAKYIHPEDQKVIKSNNNKAKKTGFATFKYRFKTKWGYKNLTTKIIHKKVNGEITEVGFSTQT